MKRLFTLFIALACTFSVARAQYLYPNIGAGNPGGLNADTEYPEGGGQPAGWSSISTAANTTPVWSSVVNLPFSFSFNGQAQTAFKVSTSGVLTFSTSATAVPSSTAAAVPSAAIPENSVFCWGVSGRGTNDKIFTKVFGSAPNRQMWIQFNSFSLPAPAAATCFTYFAIVLEETTNKFYIVDQRNSACVAKLSIGYQIDGTSAMAVFGSPNLNQKAGSDPTDVDNVYYEFVPGVQPSVDLKLTSIDAPKFVTPSSNIDLGFSVVNQGSADVTALVLNYTVNNGPVRLSPVNSTISANGDAGNFTHVTPITVSGTDPIQIKAWITTVGDNNGSNDTLNAVTGIIAFQATKRIVFEEATGTWCQWCPRGAVFMDSLAKLYPTTAMAIAVHNGDPMTVAEYDAGLSAAVPGYPSGLVDRKGGPFDPSDFITEHDNRITETGVACDVTVDATYNSTTREYNITMGAVFATYLQGDLRFNCVIVEDDVTGTATGYRQSNAYSGGANGPMGNYHNLPNPVPAAQMVYDHVARAILGGWEGTELSIPATVAANSTHSFNYTYTLPAGYDDSQIHIIGWVMDATTGEILNANQKNFATGVATQKASNFSLSTFPNPSKGLTNFEVKMDQLKGDISLEVYDLTGRLVYTTSEGSVVGGSKFLTWEAGDDVANGIYQAVVKVGNESVAAKVALTR